MFHQTRTKFNKSLCISGHIYVPYAALFIFIILSVFIHTYLHLNTMDTDNYFQLAHAKVLLESGFIREEPLSMHTGLNFIIPQWLTAVIIYGLFTAGGAALTGLFFHVISVFIFVGVYKLARLYTDTKRCLLILAVYIPVFFWRTYATRPHVLSLLILTAELYILEMYFREKGWRRILVIPFLSILCINIHNSLWLMMFIIMLPYLAEMLCISGFHIPGMLRGYKEIFTVIPLTLAAGLVNPYGIDGITYIIDSMASIRPAIPHIMELMPSAVNNRGCMVIVLLFFLLFIALFSDTRGKITIRYTLLAGGMILMAMLNNRNINQALVCIIPLVCILLNGLTVTEEDLTRKLFFSDKMTVCVAAFTCGIVLLTNIGVVTMSQTNKAIGYLLDHYSEDIKIFNTINQGSMLEYYGYKPYIDTRLEVFGKENNGTFDYLGEYFDICEGKTRLEDVVKKYDFDVLFLVNIEGTPIERGLKEIPFKTVYNKDGAFILEKENQG